MAIPPTTSPASGFNPGELGGVPTFVIPPAPSGDSDSDTGGLTASQIREALNQGRLTRAQAIKMLARYGYNAQDAQLYLALDTRPSSVRGSVGGGGGGSTGAKGPISANTAIQEILKKNPRWSSFVPLINGLADELDVDEVFLLAAVVARNPVPERVPSFARAFAIQLRKKGTIDGAYRAVAPKAKVRPSSIVPARYVGGRIDLSPTQAPLTPEQSIAQSIYRSDLKEELTNPWVVIDKEGKIKFVSNRKKPGVPPKGSLGIRRDEFLDVGNDLNEAFEAYVGRKAKAGEVAMIIKKGWSEYQIKSWLSQQDGFTSSLVFRTTVPSYLGIAREILGTSVWNSIGPAERTDLLRKAVVEDWNGDVFAEALRAMPQYRQGAEYQGNVANLRGVYESIYSIPDDPSEMALIEQAAAAQWDADQFAANLRSRPEYAGSGEYLSKVMNVLGSLGAVVGGLPALAPTGNPQQPYTPKFGGV